MGGANISSPHAHTYFIIHEVQTYFMYDQIRNMKLPHYPISADAEWLISDSYSAIFFFNTDKPKRQHVSYLGPSFTPPFIHQVSNTLQLITGVWVTLRELNKKMKMNRTNQGREIKSNRVLGSCKAFPSPQKAPDIHTTHWGAGLCGEWTAIVTAVSGQAVIVQLPLWDWLKRAGPPYDLNTYTHILRGIFHMFSHGDFFLKHSAALGRSHLTCFVTVEKVNKVVIMSNDKIPIVY